MNNKKERLIKDVENEERQRKIKKSDRERKKQIKKKYIYRQKQI